MTLQDYFQTPEHIAEKADLPLLSAVIARYADERPLAGAQVVMGHILVRNSLVVAEALVAGGAALTIAQGFPSASSTAMLKELRAAGVEVLPNGDAVERGAYFLDVNAILGRLRTPSGAAEVTRTGVHHYRRIPCAVVSADDCNAKKIEGFFGTGDGFLRAWRMLRPDDPLAGKRMVQFGYGKIGRGVAHVSRRAGLQVTIAEVNAAVRARAEAEGFFTVYGEESADLQSALAEADIVLAVTGLPSVLSRTVPSEWLRANQPVLVNLGAEDEYGEHFSDEDILGGKAVPLNFHLANPTQNRYVDAPLAAHVLALEALLRRTLPRGIHPLPTHMDEWLLTEWRRHWPDEDLSGIAEELGVV